MFSYLKQQGNEVYINQIAPGSESGLDLGAKLV